MPGLIGYDEWAHTGRLVTKIVSPHKAEPYARIGNDTRCMHCGDIIEKQEKWASQTVKK